MGEFPGDLARRQSCPDMAADIVIDGIRRLEGERLAQKHEFHREEWPIGGLRGIGAVFWLKGRISNRFLDLDPSSPQ